MTRKTFSKIHNSSPKILTAFKFEYYVDLELQKQFLVESHCTCNNNRTQILAINLNQKPFSLVVGKIN